MKSMHNITTGLLLAAAASPALSNTITVNSLGDNGPGNCSSSCTLRDAIATALSGDTIEFNIALPWTITLTGTELAIGTPLSIIGPGADLLSVSANNASRVMNVSAAVMISGLTLRDGNATGPGAGGVGAGGCVLFTGSGSQLTLSQVAVVSCSATGAQGATGSTGGIGQAGGSAEGGCIFTGSGSQLSLSQVEVSSCQAVGGMGGKGGNGAFSPLGHGSHGGAGGVGGYAQGAVFAQGSISLVQSSISGCMLNAGTGGTGGRYGYGGAAMSDYAAGAGGKGGSARGGGIFSGAGTLLVSNSTIAGCHLTGGTGGAGGQEVPGDPASVGPSGAGGKAEGGSVYVDASVLTSNVEFSTLTGNTLVAGVGGTYPYAAANGSAAADALYTVAPSSIRSSIVASTSSNSDCAGPISAQGANFDQNSTCSGFSVHGSVANNLKPLSVSNDGTWAMMPRYGSAVIDAALDCKKLDNTTAVVDQHATARPQGPACDLGAVEADYIFVGEFE